MIFNRPIFYLTTEELKEIFNPLKQVHDQALQNSIIKSMKTKHTKPVQVFKATNKQWYFHVRAKNGEIICQSEGYKNKRDAYKAISVLWSVLTKHIMPDME